MRDDIPDPWRPAAERRGIPPTYRPLAARAKVSHETVRRLIQGRTTSETTVRKVADALGVDVEKIHEWRGEAPPDYGAKFDPDPSSVLLTTDERAVINSLIRLLTDGRENARKDGGEHESGSASMKRAGGSSAPRDVISNAGFGSPDGGPGQGASPPSRRGPRRPGRS